MPYICWRCSLERAMSAHSVERSTRQRLLARNCMRCALLWSNTAQYTGVDIPKPNDTQEATMNAAPMLHLEEVLQRLYDSEINVTITMLWDGGFDFAFLSYMEWPEAGTPLDDLQSFVDPKPRITESPWFHCRTAAELADAIHKAALAKFPDSGYAKLYGRPN
jgi:hypothetical protein